MIIYYLSLEESDRKISNLINDLVINKIISKRIKKFKDSKLCQRGRVGYEQKVIFRAIL